MVHKNCALQIKPTEYIIHQVHLNSGVPISEKFSDAANNTCKITNKMLIMGISNIISIVNYHDVTKDKAYNFVKAAKVTRKSNRK